MRDSSVGGFSKGTSPRAESLDSLQTVEPRLRFASSNAIFRIARLNRFDSSQRRGRRPSTRRRDRRNEAISSTDSDDLSSRCFGERERESECVCRSRRLVPSHAPTSSVTRIQKLSFITKTSPRAIKRPLTKTSTGSPANLSKATTEPLRN